MKEERYISRHAQKRFEERHGLVFTNAQAKIIVENIISKKAKFIKSDKKTEQWISECEDKKYRIIYSLKNKIIVTVYSGIKKKRKRPINKKTPCNLKYYKKKKREFYQEEIT